VNQPEMRLAEQSFHSCAPCGNVQGGGLHRLRAGYDALATQLVKNRSADQANQCESNRKKQKDNEESDSSAHLMPPYFVIPAQTAPTTSPQACIVYCTVASKYSRRRPSSFPLKTK
jgi:hypothetical protein